jgi:hypothetical protein
MRAEMTVLRCATAANRLPTGHGRACGPAGEAAPRPYPYIGDLGAMVRPVHLTRRPATGWGGDLGMP